MTRPARPPLPLIQVRIHPAQLELLDAAKGPGESRAQAIRRLLFQALPVAGRADAAHQM